MSKRVFTDEMIYFMKSNGEKPRPWITEQLNAMFSCSLKIKQVQSKCSELRLFAENDGRLKKGVPSWNKGIPNSTGFSSTRFKKGHKLSERVPVGYESLIDGYVMIKYEANKPMRLKHHVVWESVRGVIPDNHVIAFKDRNALNCDIDNLVLMSRAELVRLAQSFIKYSTPETHETCILLAKLKDARHRAVV